MPISVDWYNEEKTIVTYRLEGRWVWDDLYEAVQNSRAMVMSVDHPVDLIIDASSNYSVPPGALTHLRTITAGASSNWRLGVFVGLSTFMDTLLKTFIKVYPKFGERYRVAHTFEEALDIIQKLQNSEPPVIKP